MPATLPPACGSLMRIVYDTLEGSGIPLSFVQSFSNLGRENILKLLYGRQPIICIAAFIHYIFIIIARSRKIAFAYLPSTCFRQVHYCDKCLSVQLMTTCNESRHRCVFQLVSRPAGGAINGKRASSAHKPALTALPGGQR